jgi:hypothetical protein
MDMNDKVGEAQLAFAGSETNAAAGYFASVNFNTSVTGTAFTIRVFGQPTDYTINNNTPIFAWDNVAITKAANFTAPTLVPEPTTAFLSGLSC